jgi:hypothetical protein
MASEREGFVVGGLNLNDGVTFDLEELGFKPATARPLWSSNPDADGDLLTQEPTYGPAEFNPRVRVGPQVNMDTALAAHGQIVDVLQRAARTDGGVPVEWTPAGSNRTYTGWALLGEISDLPVTATGDLAGWFFNSPVLSFKLTCKPFFERPEKQVLAGVESTAPFQTAYISGVEGDVPAEARMIVTDKAGQVRQHLEWGQEVLEKEAGAPNLLIDSDSLIAVGGAQAEHVGAGEFHNASGSGPNVIKATLSPTAIVMARTGDIANIGSFRLKLRVCVQEPGVKFQAHYQVGDGPFRAAKQDWVEPPMNGTYKPCEIDLGEVTFEAVEKGTQRAEVRFVAKTDGGSKWGEIDYLGLIPTRRYGVARAPALYETPTAYVARDPFDQPAGALTGKVAPLGGTWEGSGDPADFQVTGSGAAQRTEVGDEFETGRSAFLSGASYKDITVQGTVEIPAGRGYFFNHYGVMARRSTTVNKVLGLIAPEGARWWAGVYVKSPNFPLAGDWIPFPVAGREVDLRLQVNADGRYRFWVDGVLVLAGQDSSLATGSTYETGKIGLFDVNASASVGTRAYKELAAFVPTLRAVCYANKGLEVRSDSQQREASEGSAWGDMPHYRGADFYLDPAGGVGRVNRIAVKMRRGDLVTDQDTNISDKQRLEVWAKPRFLVPR